MNWTGGSLQRWKNTPKGIAQKQKAHFARVRAQMQNGHRSSSPVRPNFFQKGEDRLGSQLPPPLSPRAFGHTGHSKTRQEQDTLHREASSGWFKRKQSSGDANAEEQLLEARRKRLLQQHDWAGLKALSRPAELQFRSPEEKKMIGKRRKPRDRGIRAVTKKPEVSLSRREFENSRPHGPYMNGTLPKEAISIRFGSDALTSAVPQTKSSASSDTMLFDNESLHTAAVESPMRIGDDHIPRTFVGAHEPEMRGEHWQSHRYSDLDHVRGISRQKGGSLENHYQSADARFQEEDRLSGCYIAQQVGGVTRPLRLIFDRTSDSSPSSAEKYGAAQGHDIGVTSQFCAPANARLDEKGKTHEQPGRNDAWIDQLLDVDGPWKPFLPISDDDARISISADVLEAGEHTYRPDHDHSRKMSAEPVAWSQQATQGNEAHINKSYSVSSSLPSITRYSDTDAPECRPHIEDERGNQWSEDYDELMWEIYRKADDPTALHAGTEDAVEEQASASRRTIASCGAVRSLSSPPSRSVPWLTYRISDSVQDIAARAPPSASSGSMIPWITSSAAQLNSKSFGEGENWSIEGQDWHGHGGIGEQSVTQTPIQVNVSCDSDASSPRISGEPKALASRCGLGRGDGCTIDRFGPDQVKRHEPASIYDIPVSEE